MGKRRLILMILLAGSSTLWSNEVSLEAATIAYQSSPFASFSQDYFARFSRDPEARATSGEVVLSAEWQIMVASNAAPLTARMAQHLAEFLANRMEVPLPVRKQFPGEAVLAHSILLLDREGGRPDAAGSFTLRVTDKQVLVQGQSPQGLRDGVVQLVDQLGFRAAPMLTTGEQVFVPRQKVRLVAVPWLGGYRDVAFLGGNAVILTERVDTRKTSYTELLPLSTSQAIPELAKFYDANRLGRLAENARAAKQYGLQTYVALYMWGGYPDDAAIFTNHPGLRGAEIYRHEDQPALGFIPCTEHPLMQQYLAESVRGLFQAVPLDGVHVIIGGEVFQHCFMRPVGAKKGHTNCDRCERLGAETVVANLCNLLGEAARSVNPDAALIAWPYTATHFWAADGDQRAFVAKLKPGTALMTEMEKEESLIKYGGPEGNITKRIWDYSIDYIGPTPRALRQIEFCKERGIAVHLKSEPELAFEAPGLPYIPCLDRWYDRADAMAGSGASGGWVFPWFQAGYGSTSAEVYKFAWWEPGLGKEPTLTKLAARIAGVAAAPKLREAWYHVSQAITNSPDLPPYFCGPYYLGPAHPMCADLAAELPPNFQARSRFGPHVLTGPTCTPLQAGRNYRRMEQCLSNAVQSLAAAAPLVPGRCELTFKAEALPAQWFYHVVRTHANFYESCLMRDALAEFITRKSAAPGAISEAQRKYERWRAVLEDERVNTVAAIPVVQQDPRLDVRFGFGGAALAPAADMMRAKLELLDHELNVYLPSVAKRLRAGGS